MHHIKQKRLTASTALDYTGKNVLVVGGTSGIGNGIAAGMRDAGANVYIWGRRANPAAYEGEENDFENMHFSQVDVSDIEQVNRFEPKFNSLDVLVLSQGTSSLEDGISEYGAAKFSQVLDLNTTSFMACSVKFKEELKAASGCIIMLSSVASVVAIAEQPAYCASKHAVNGLTQSLALAWAPEGIRVNAIGPGLVPSRMAKAVTDNPEYLAAVIAANPLGRIGQQSDVANAALFLGSPMASYITGQTLIIDGGQSLGRP